MKAEKKYTSLSLMYMRLRRIAQMQDYRRDSIAWCKSGANLLKEGLCEGEGNFTASACENLRKQ